MSFYQEIYLNFRALAIKIQQSNASIFLAVLLCFAKIFRESCVEKYKEFNGVNISSTIARTNVLGSLNLKAGMNSRSL